MTKFERLFVFCICLLFMACIAGIVQEIDHPCVREDPHLIVTSYITTGDVTIPVYGHACLERK